MRRSSLDARAEKGAVAAAACVSAGSTRRSSTRASPMDVDGGAVGRSPRCTRYSLMANARSLFLIPISTRGLAAHGPRRCRASFATSRLFARLRRVCC